MIQLYRPKVAHLGRHSYSTPDLYVNNPKETVIGSFTSIGTSVRIGHGTHPAEYMSTSPYIYLNRLGYKTAATPSHSEWEDIAPVHIGNDVWIGDCAFIKNGVTIGDGAIIGAHSVVTHDVPPYAIAVGIPARVIKYRFPENIIRELLELKWWDLPDEIIKTLIYDDIQTCLAQLRQIRKNQIPCEKQA